MRTVPELTRVDFKTQPKGGTLLEEYCTFSFEITSTVDGEQYVCIDRLCFDKYTCLHRFWKGKEKKEGKEKRKDKCFEKTIRNSRAPVHFLSPPPTLPA